jgi:L,D-transpeptidase catalytic domain
VTRGARITGANPLFYPGESAQKRFTAGGMFRIEALQEGSTVRIFMSGTSLFRSALALLVMGLLASCAEIEPPYTPAATVPAPTPMPYAWNGDGVPGKPKIVVHIGKQRAYFFKGNALVGETTVSTGKPGFSTPPGQYRVVWKNEDHISTRFGDYVDDYGNVVKSNVDSRKDRKPPGTHFDGARMPFAMFFKGGYAMHQGYVPPYAASHGCIRLPGEVAEIFFNASPLGTPVVVKP